MEKANTKNKKLIVGETFRHHITPFKGLIVEDESLEFTKINLDHPLRNAVTESEALNDFFKIINKDLWPFGACLT